MGRGRRRASRGADGKLASFSHETSDRIIAFAVSDVGADGAAQSTRSTAEYSESGAEYSWRAACAFTGSEYAWLSEFSFAGSE
jgi:hypothetical protein